MAKKIGNNLLRIKLSIYIILQLVLKLYKIILSRIIFIYLEICSLNIICIPSPANSDDCFTIVDAK